MRLIKGVPTPGVRRGYTHRDDGSMKDPAARKAALASVELGERPAFYLRQVHGTMVVRVDDALPPEQAPEADGWVTNVPGLVLCVFMADCVPLFVWDKSGRAAGVFHAGWRGLAKGMPRRAVEAFKEHYGIEPKDLRAEIGPHIGACCYRVGPETAEQFRPSSRIERRGGIYLDLRSEARAQLAESGLEDMPVETAAECTSCHNDKLFSFRREKSDGRMMAFITLDPQ
jgi:hypothetical protein